MIGFLEDLIGTDTRLLNNPKTFNKLLDIYPELLENKSINEFFALYNDSSQK